ncbi:MAG: rhombosortase [Pseudomonadota bacterium]
MRSGTPLAREMLRLPLADWAGVVVPVGFALTIALGGNVWRLLLRYERDLPLLLSEPWRLISAHLVHMNGAHLLLDGVAFALIWLLFAGILPARAWWAAFVGGCLAIDAGLYLWQPEVGWYVGLSGVEHGLFVAGAGWMALTRRPGAALMVIGLGLKLAWEVLVGPMPWSTSASRGPVIEVAHLYGTVGGLIALGLLLALDESCRERLSVRRQGQ